MNFDQFKTDALRTESRPEALNFNLTGLAALLSAAVLMAKIMDTAKKTMFYGKPLDVGQLREQLDQLEDMAKGLGRAGHLLGDPKAIIRTAGNITTHMPNLRIAHGAIGMFGEAGELLEAVLKQIATGELDLVNVAEETGDSDWYKAIIHDEADVSEEQSRAKVIAKLKKRYGEKFSSEAALNRDLVAERQVLETTEA